MAATLHAGIIPGDEAKKLYSYPTLPADSDKLLLGNGTWGDVYAHPAYATLTGAPTANQTPAFGKTFTVNQVNRDATGHISAITNRTIKIPDSTASSTASGLMSAADKKAHDSLVSMFNGSWTTEIDASGCMVVKAANGVQIFRIDKAGEW